MTALLQTTKLGLYCPVGKFYVDPWKPVDRAIITHAHADHACWGSKQYLVAETGQHVSRIRLGAEAKIDVMPFGKSQEINGVKVSFVPAGHILGSAQVRLEHRGEIVVVSGDYKRNPDPTCVDFEPVRCHTFVTESTFGLPIYRWPDAQSVFDQINQWWRQNQEEGKTSVLLAYALGKAQRMLAGVDPSIGSIYTHGAVEKLTAGYRESGIQLPPTQNVMAMEKGFDFSQSLIIAPPSALGTSWAKRFGKLSCAMASGWMQIRGTRRRRSMDRGFILSDHVDWEDLMQTVRETEAEEVLVTHGYSAIVVRHLKELGIDAKVLETEFVGEELIEGSDSTSDVKETEPADDDDDEVDSDA